MKPRIVICATKVPFAYGGAEMLVDSLRDELKSRGFEVDVVAIPFHWPTRVELLKGSLAWRLVNLEEAAGKRIDLVIATRFPSYLVKHPNKVVWLIHQLRQAYDLLGTRYSDFTDRQPWDAKVLEMIRTMDRRTLSEARSVFTISGNVADRLRRNNSVEAEVLYPPPKLDPLYHSGPSGDFIFTIGRLDAMKRFDLLVRAMKHTETPVRCRIAGTGPEREALIELIARLGIEERVELLGWTKDEDVVEHYANCLGVYYAPYDEDYGYVTVEAFKAAKPVITTADAGGVLEFVEDDRNGYICPSDSPRDIGARIDALYRDREKARTLGLAGQAKVREITWDRVIEKLTGASSQ
ncbi:MAG TPA: glycosyltransferase family 4 protein [Thermoanaerobaculia bacterium]|nr:glycosyltransferase family 4 protein [Thermoanaerobaculia bacterium]